MVANITQFEMEMETQARTKRFVVHRSPGIDHSMNRCSYYVCDQNNNVLFPSHYRGQLSGATVEDAHEWLSIH